MMSSRLLSINGLAVALALTMNACGGTDNGGTTPSSTTPATFTLSGQITDSATGTGIPGAAASILDGPNAGKFSTTDGAGRYSLADLPASGFTLSVSATAYGSQSRSVTLTANQTLSIQLQRTNTATNAPASLTATAGSGFVVLTWTDSPDATSYNVYRQDPGSVFNRVATGVPVRVGSLRQAGLMPGVTFSYYMTSVNASGESAPSNVVTVTAI